MERTCVGCRAVADARSLLRIVAVDGVAVVDATRTLPGRGAHLHPSAACRDLALRRRALPRALRETGLDVEPVASDPRFL